MELQESDGVVDIVTLQDKLNEKGVPMEINNVEYLGNLVAAVPTSANIKQYCQIVSEKSLLRKLIRLNEDMPAILAGRIPMLSWRKPRRRFSLWFRNGIRGIISLSVILSWRQ